MARACTGISFVQLARCAADFRVSGSWPKASSGKGFCISVLGVSKFLSILKVTMVAQILAPNASAVIVFHESDIGGIRSQPTTKALYFLFIVPRLTFRRHLVREDQGIPIHSFWNPTRKVRRDADHARAGAQSTLQ